VPAAELVRVPLKQLSEVSSPSDVPPFTRLPIHGLKSAQALQRLQVGIVLRDDEFQEAVVLEQQHLVRWPRWTCDAIFLEGGCGAASQRFLAKRGAPSWEPRNRGESTPVEARRAESLNERLDVKLREERPVTASLLRASYLRSTHSAPSP
jgi:hypothetical protein